MNKITFFLCLMFISNHSFSRDSKGTFSFALENDLIGSGSDKHYTHGTEFSYVSDTYVPNWLKTTASFFPFHESNNDTRYSWSLGQKIFTPSNLEKEELIEDDRPYAGWLNLSLGLVTEDIQENYRHVDSIEFIFGVVGPKSMAENIQKSIHRRTGSTPPQGWDNQLDDEYTLDLRYRRSWIIPIINNRFDYLPSVGFTAGSSQRLLNFGGTLRIGSGLFSDFGPPLIRPTASGAYYFKPDQPFYWYFFIGLHGRFVDYNIFLDGNIDDKSHSVKRLSWVGDIQTGFILGTGNWRLSLTNIFRTKEFEKQNNPDDFGSLVLSYRF
ncbi:MAG: lipid A deacylase LpxR family protein [Cellvibrionaceae bacterium]